MMHMSEKGLTLLKSFEGCRLTAYWDVNGYSIGYGHHASNITKGMAITQAVADQFLLADLKKFETAVSSYNYEFTQGQFDALVDFAYNCGVRNLKSLLQSGKRSLSVVADKILLYNKAGGVVLKGLQNRRKAERELFLSSYTSPASVDGNISPQLYYPLYTGSSRGIVNALKELGFEADIETRRKIAGANGIDPDLYKGSAADNNYLLSLLKDGKLKRFES